MTVRLGFTDQYGNLVEMTETEFLRWVGEYAADGKRNRQHLLEVVAEVGASESSTPAARSEVQ